MATTPDGPATLPAAKFIMVTTTFLILERAKKCPWLKSRPVPYFLSTRNPR